MTWGLFVHNTPLISEGFVAPDGSDIPATTVFTGTPNFAGSVEGMFAVAPGGRIMALPAGTNGTSVMYSDDHGATWTETGTLPAIGADAWVVTRVIHSAFHDAWFAHYRVSNSMSTVIYSTDNGANWTDMSLYGGPPYHPHRYTSNCILVDDAGALYVGGRTADFNGIEVHKYPDPISSGKSSYTNVEVAGNSNSYNMAWAGDNIIMYVLVPYLTDNRGRAYLVAKDLSSSSHLCDLSEDETSSSRDFGGTPWAADGDGLVLAFASDLSPATSSSAAYSPLTDDISATWPPPTETYSVGEDCQEPYVAGYGNSHFLFGHRPTGDLDRYILTHSLDGYAWASQSTLNLDASRDTGNTASLLRKLSGSTWILGIVSSNKMKLLTFQYGELSAPAPPRSALSLGIRRQSPDIFIMLDDTGSPSSVTDIGSKDYTNATSGTITFEQSGLVDDGGTAALFGGGSITVDVTSGAYEHAHVFILSHDGTASERTLLSFNGFTLKLDASGNVVFLDGTETITSSAVTADTATFVALHLEQISCGTKANLYVGAAHVGQELSSLEPALAGDLALGGSGVTIDYYAMISSEFADVAALQRAFGLSPSLPNAPTSALCGDVKLLVRADEAPVAQQVKPPSLGYWVDAYTIKNIANGEREVYWWQDGGDAVYQAAGGKFSGGLYVPSISPGSVYRYPQSEPAWLGYAGLELGTRDFSLAAWVKPGASGFFHLGISTRYKIQSGYSIPYGGFAFTVFITPAGPGSWVTVGQPLGAYGPGSPRSRRFALQEAFSPFPSYTPNAWNFVTLCRKNGRFYVTVNGRMAGSRSTRSGSQGAAIVSPGAGAELFMGWNEAPDSAISGGATRTSRLAYQGSFDDLVLVLDEALYTQEFTPPTSRFEL